MSDEMRAELKMKSMKKLRNNQEQLMILTQQICRQLGPADRPAITTSFILTPTQSTEIQLIVQLCRRSYEVNAIPAEVQREVCQPSAASTAIIFATVIKRVFHFLQSIPQLKALDQETQTNLLKQRGMESLIVLSALTFDPVRRKWSTREFTKSLVKEPNPMHVCEKDFERLHGGTVTRKHFDMLCSFLSLNADEPIVTLLALVAFFSLDDHQQGSREAAQILAIQEHFIELLKRYVHWKMGPEISEKAFARFILKLSDVREVDNLHKVLTSFPVHAVLC